MKKTLKFIGLFAMAAVLFSCEKKVDPVNDTPKNPEEQGIDLSQFDPSEYLVSFGATIEAPQTKATITIGNTEASVEFDDNDEVLVVSGGNSATYVYNKNGNQFTPEGEPLKYSTDEILFYYPAGNFNTSGVFTMPDAAADLADLGDKAPMAAKAAAGETVNVTFKNVASILQVGITGNRTLEKVQLSADEFIGDGTTFAVSWSGDTPSMASGEGSAKSISVSSSVTLSDTPAIFYFIVPAGIDLTGVNVTAFLTTKDNGSMEMFTIDRGNWNATPGNIYKMSFYAGLFSGGTGTSEDPYIIANARDFKHINTYITNGYGSLAAGDFLAAYYQQTADINFKNVQMAPIGDSDHRFTGEYDGNGKQLQNVNINETGQFAGIFAYVNGSASIKDLTVSGNITKTGSTDNSCVGGIAGIVRGAATVTGCTNNATITSSATYTGGIAGRLYDSTADEGISSCTNNGAVTASAPNTGGIVGQQIGGGKISGCENAGTVTGTSVVGGVAGMIVGGVIESCFSTGVVTGTAEYIGGLVGQVGNGSAHAQVQKCWVNASVYGGGQGTGGIAGIIQNGVLNTCFAKGSVTSSLYDTGGIVGIAFANGSAATNRPYVYDCIAANNVTCTRSSGSANIGGVIGRLIRNSNYTGQFAAVHNCIGLNQEITLTNALQYAGAFVGYVNASHNTNYNRVVVSNCISLVTDENFHVTTSTSNVGGFVGNYAGRINHCYYLVNTNNQTATAKRSVANELTKSDLSTLTSSDFCSEHNTRALTDNDDYYLYVNSVKYQSLGWTLPDDCPYPVPTSLYNLGSEYYK